LLILAALIGGLAVPVWAQTCSGRSDAKAFEAVKFWEESIERLLVVFLFSLLHLVLELADLAIGLQLGLIAGDRLSELCASSTVGVDGWSLGSSFCAKATMGAAARSVAATTSLRSINGLPWNGMKNHGGCWCIIDQAPCCGIGREWWQTAEVDAWMLGARRKEGNWKYHWARLVTDLHQRSAISVGEALHQLSDDLACIRECCRIVVQLSGAFGCIAVARSDSENVSRHLTPSSAEASIWLLASINKESQWKVKVPTAPLERFERT
jgi:hypothetical protein